MTSASNTPAITGNKATTQRKFPTILLIIFFLFSVGITVSGYYYFKSQEGQLVSLAENNLIAIADLKARQITNWRSERVGDANILFESSLTSERLTRFMNNPSDTGSRAELGKWLESRRRNYNYENIWFFSAKGVPMLWTGENVENRSGAFSDLFDSAARSKTVVFSDLRIIPGKNQSIMELFCPVFNRTKSTLVGIMILRIDPRLFLFPLVQEWPVPSRTSKCFLAETWGDTLIFLSEHGYEKNIATYKRPLTTSELPAVRAARGSEPIIREIDQRGIPIFVAIRKIPDCPWLVAARTNEDEIYEPLQESKWQISIIVAILILGAAGAIGLYWQKNSTEFYRRQYELESERKALATHFDYLTKYANDIIILMDADNRIVEANDRAMSAYGYSMDELVGMNGRKLRALSELETFERDIRRVEVDNGALFETVHRRKDGSTFPVEISSRLIEIEGKKFQQGIIRDITERNQAKKEIEKLNRLYAVLSETNKTIVRITDQQKLFDEICRIAIEIGYFRLAWVGRLDGEVVTAIASAGKSDGYVERLKISIDETQSQGRGPTATALRERKTVVVQDFERSEQTAPWREDALKRGYRSSISIPLTVFEKTWGALQFYSSEPFFFDQKELRLLEELAGDVSFAVETMKREEQRKIAEEASHQKDVELRLFAEATFEGINIQEGGRFVKVNDQFARMFGYETEEMIGKSILMLVPPESQQVVQGHVRDQRTDPYEAVLLRKDGTRLFAEIRGMTLMYNGKLSRQTVVRDLTERKKAEERLRVSENQLSEAQHIAHIGSSRWNANTDTTVWSEEMYRITGWDPALPGPTNEERAKLYTPESYAILRLAIARAMEKGEPYDLELDIVRRDGEVRHVLMMGRAVSDEHNKISGLSGTMQDITERKRAEDKIKEREAQYAELVETARDAIYTVSSKATFTSINRAFESVTGWKREEWLGKPFVDVLHPDDQKRLVERFSLSMTGQSQPLDEVRLRTKSGSYILVELSTVPQTRNERVIGVLGVGRDVTERKQLEEQLRRTQRLDSIGSLASGIAHDLNNVLGPVMLGVDVLLRKSPDDSTKKVLQTMRTSSKRGSDIVKQVLAFARGTEQERSPQQLRYVINEMQSFVRQTFPKDIELKIDVPKDLPSILGDSTQLHQILLNLCVNARDAMPSGGRIQISASKIELGISDLNGHPGLAPGMFVRLSVSDSGTGIPEAIRAKIFDPFFTTKEVGKGTGLGLSTVNSIVRDHKGFLNLISEVGRGTEFQIFFPAVEQKELGPERQEEKEVPRGNGEGILVVDDELSVVSLAREALEAYNYKVYTAPDGIEATLLFNTQPHGSIAVVVSDINMPRMSGVDLVKTLKNSDPKLKVLVTSGSPAQKEAKRAELEMYRFLPKPFSADQLLREIDNLLHEAGGVLPHA